MSRGFFGGSTGSGSKRPGAAKADPTKKKDNNMMLAMSRKRHKTMNEMIRERTSAQMKDYDEMVEDLLDAKMTSTERGTNQFNLPGSKPPEDKKITKGRQAAIDHFKMQRMKERMKKRDQKVEVIPKLYTGDGNGGWIDKKGKIRNSHGVIVMEVNVKNGVISNRMGMKVGKYNPHSMANDFKIQRLIKRFTQDPHKHSNPFAGPNQGEGAFNPFGGKK